MALIQNSTSVLLAFVLSMLLVVPQNAAAHVVPLSKVNEDVQSAAEVRQGNISKVQSLLTHPHAQQLLRTSNLDTTKAQQAVTLLSDQELNELAARASQAENDIAAGLTRGQTSLLILVGAVVVIILVIAAAT